MSSIAPDVAAHRAWLASLVDLPSSGSVLDLGCGTGHDLMLLARRASTPDVRFLGVDRSAKSVAESQRASAHLSHVNFEVIDLTTTLPWSDGSFDVVFSNNYLECVPHLTPLLNDVAHIVRPGGQVVFGHWDWDTQVFNGEDRDRVRRLVHAFAD